MRSSIVFTADTSKQFAANSRRGDTYNATIQNLTTQTITITVTNQDIQSASPVFDVPSGGALTIVAGAVGEINETGPLATDVHLVPLPQNLPNQAKIRLRLTKGHWRIDYIALAVLGKRVEPIRLKPSLVRRNAIRDDIAREALLDSTRQLITLPGDVVTLMYRLPEDFVEYELFLESRGYYLEWIRDEWVADEDLSRATMIFLNPELALRKLAPEFKQVEAEIEELFWNSRYAQ